MEPLTGADSRKALDLFIDHNLKMMVFCGALVAACQAENGWWCVQYAGGDPQLIPHEYATALTEGFHLGVTRYHEYRVAQRELAVCLAEVDAEEAAK